MSSRIMHFTAKGFKPQLIDIARDASDPPSKRSDIIEKEDKALNYNLDSLEISTKARNKALEDRLHAVWDMSNSWEARLLTEKDEASESIKSVKNQYSEHLKEFQNNILSLLHKTYDKYDDVSLPTQSKRVDVIEKDYRFYFDKTVPAAIEAQSGEVSRQLKKAYETFDIEKQKEGNREKKFVLRANDHIQATAQKMLDESALMTACFYNLTDDVVEHERRAIRMHNRRWDSAVEAIIEIQEVLKLECALRKDEDMNVLDTILETQTKLQQTILEHFGMSPEDIGLSPSKKKIVGTPKLTKRMEKINRKKSNRESIAEEGSPASTPTGSARKSPRKSPRKASGRGSPGGMSVASSYNSSSDSESDGESGSESGSDFSGSEEEFERK